MVDLDNPAEFYAEMTKRNAGLISASNQQKLATCRVVVAGCGSTGGATVVPLVRTGVTRFVLADPDSFDLSNLNRQNATVADIGRNKAAVAGEAVRAINPHADVTVLEQGIEAGSADALLEAGDVVIDAIDVTTASGIVAKKALHAAAGRTRVPVITAYDIAACQFIEVFDYRKGGKPFGGKLDKQTSPEDVLAALIPPTVLPEEILPVIADGSVSGEHGFPQLAMTASLFGALITPIVLRLLANEPLPSRIRVDLFGITTPRPARVARRTRTLARLPFVWMAARKRASAS